MICRCTVANQIASTLRSNLDILWSKMVGGTECLKFGTTVLRSNLNLEIKLFSASGIYHYRAISASSNECSCIRSPFRYAQSSSRLRPPFIILLQSLSDSLTPPVAVVGVIVVVAIVAVVLSHATVATASTIVSLKVLKPQSSRLPVDAGSWTSAASPPAISGRILSTLPRAVALVFP